jgi:hypothetical protein
VAPFAPRWACPAIHGYDVVLRVVDGNLPPLAKELVLEDYSPIILHRYPPPPLGRDRGGKSAEIPRSMGCRQCTGVLWVLRDCLDMVAEETVDRKPQRKAQG